MGSGFCKAPRNDEIALQHFFFLLAAVQEFFFYFNCAACNFFLPTRAREALAGNFVFVGEGVFVLSKHVR